MRRKFFISYMVQRIIGRFGPPNFIKRGVTAPLEIISSTSTADVLLDLGAVSARLDGDDWLVTQWTWRASSTGSAKRRHSVPLWDVPNLIGILLRERTPQARINRDRGCARYHYYPPNVSTLADWIEDAYHARGLRAQLSRHAAKRFAYNRRCP